MRAPDTTGARLYSRGPEGAREPPCGGVLEITKPIFGFKRVSNFFCPNLNRSAGPLRPRARGLDGALLRREVFAGPVHCEVQLVLLLLPMGVLALRAPFQCGPLGRDGLVEEARFDRSSAFSP